MRKAAVAIIAIGLAIAFAGGALERTARTGQEQAKTQWVNEVRAPEADSGPRLSRLAFPEKGQELFVVEGASGENLLRGPARLEWSVNPGERGNCVIAAHRDTHFRILKDLRMGEQITVEHGGRTFQYRIVALRVVSQANNTYYQPTNDAVLTLVTCYPFSYLGKAPQRFIVRAQLVESAG